ncbi:MAG: MopE-related protein [Myxococcota bacterium]
MRWWSIFCVSALIVGCDGSDKEDSSNNSGNGSEDSSVSGEAAIDNDGDGYSASEDCADNDAQVRPGIAETCDGIDNNCNGLIDEGFGDSDSDAIADCIDVEECDGVDNNGDGIVDENFPDSDGDGTLDCLDPEDCNGVDDDGDGIVDEGHDNDADGYTTCDERGADCDDTDRNVNPGATEIDGDNVDNDCDGQIDLGSGIGDIIFTEMLVNPNAVADPVGEWIELYNTTNAAITMDGMLIGSDADGDAHQIQPVGGSLVIPAKGYVVLAAEGSSDINGQVEADYVYSDITLSNELDDLYLKAALNVGGSTELVVLDRVAWDDGETFPDIPGATMALDPNYYDSSLNDVADSWCQGTAQWAPRSDRGTPGEENFICRPKANPAYLSASTLHTCDTLFLDATNSVTTPGADLTFEWELVSAPSDSSTTTADIATTTDALPEFIPDEPGTYIFSLTAYNGFEYSPPETLTVTITLRPDNTAPSADAGADMIYEEEPVCYPLSYGESFTCNDCAEQEFKLDGSDSSDPEGDYIEYAWSITGGNAYATIANEDTMTPTVTVSGVGADYGSKEAVSVEVTLVTTDCMGATDDDIMNIIYTCNAQ